VKTIIMIIGAGATGKTTLSCALAGENAVQHQVDLSITQKGERKRFKTPYYSRLRIIAIARESQEHIRRIGAMDALHQTIDLCLKERDTVITDGFRCTAEARTLDRGSPAETAAVFVFIELSLNTNLALLRRRRAGNGAVEAEAPPKTFLNVLRFPGEIARRLELCTDATTLASLCGSSHSPKATRQKRRCTYPRETPRIFRQDWQSRERRAVNNYHVARSHLRF